jgi:hypothetical protein
MTTHRYWGLLLVYGAEGTYIFWRWVICCFCITRKPSPEDDDMLCAGKLDTRQHPEDGRCSVIEEWFFKYYAVSQLH